MWGVKNLHNKDKKKKYGTPVTFDNSVFHQDGRLIGFHRGNAGNLDEAIGKEVLKYISAGNPPQVAVHILATHATELAFGTFGRVHALAPLITILKAILRQLEQRVPNSFSAPPDDEEFVDF